MLTQLTQTSSPLKAPKNFGNRLLTPSTLNTLVGPHGTMISTDLSANTGISSYLQVGNFFTPQIYAEVSSNTTARTSLITRFKELVLTWFVSLGNWHTMALENNVSSPSSWLLFMTRCLLMALKKKLIKLGVSLKKVLKRHLNGFRKFLT